MDHRRRHRGAAIPWEQEGSARAGLAVCDLRVCQFYYRQRPFPFTSLFFIIMGAKNPHPNGCGSKPFDLCTVRASASQGGEIALDETLCFDIACSNHLMVSPPLRGSNPYPCGSLTYRIFLPYCRAGGRVCQPLSRKKIGPPGALFSFGKRPVCARFSSVKNG